MERAPERSNAAILVVAFQTGRARRCSDLDSESDSEGEGGDEEGLFGEGGFLGSDYDSDDNSTAAQVHRFFAKVEGLGIDLGEDMFSDPWA